MNYMKSRLGSHQRSLLLIVLLVLGFAVLASASAKTLMGDDRRSVTRSKDDSITVTGCLYDAGADNKFTITGQNGKMYLLKSSKVALKDHVRHEVAVTGSIKEDDDDEDENPEYREGDVKLLIVTSLKMISTKRR
jgi:hypothetical protein